MMSSGLCTRRVFALKAGAGVLALGRAVGKAPADAPQELFLRTARIVTTHKLSRGVTGALRATLSDGKLTHDATIQPVNNRMSPLFAPDDKPVEWFDSYRYNVAAYELDRLLGLRMVAVTVERNHDAKPTAFTWWVDDILMMEEVRIAKKISPPDPRDWVRQRADVDVFDELIFNTDRNPGNLVIKRGWKLALIDHTRAFAAKPLLRQPEKVKICGSRFMESIKSLTAEAALENLGAYLTKGELDALMARRKLVVDRLSR